MDYEIWYRGGIIDQITASSLELAAVLATTIYGAGVRVAPAGTHPGWIDDDDAPEDPPKE